MKLHFKKLLLTLLVFSFAGILMGQFVPMRRLAQGFILRGNSSNVARPFDANNAGSLLQGDGTDLVELAIGNIGESPKVNAAGTSVAWVGRGNSEATYPKNVYIQGSWITPTCSLSTGGASVGADTTLTVCNLGWGLPGMWIYHTVESAGSEGPVVVVDANSTDGFEFPGSKNVDNTGATITFGGDLKSLLATPSGPTQFIVGTDAAFYMKITMSIPDVSTYDTLFIGFAEAEAAYVAAIDTQGEIITAYSEKYGFSLADAAGDIDVNTSKAGSDANADLTSTDWVDDAVKTLGVYVGATGAVTYRLWDGATEDTSLGAAAITVTDTTVLTPIIIHAKAANSTDTPPIIESIEWGYQ